MRVIITGGTGLIGRPLSAALVQSGHEVTVLSRDPIETPSMPEGVYLHRWDSKTAEGWGHLVDGADAVINLAGAGIADGRWSKERKQLIRDSRLQAGRAVMEAIRAADKKPGVLLQSSAVGYYGTDSSDVDITEEHGPGKDFLAKVCFDWEMSTAPAARMGIRRPVLRTGVVFSNAGGAFPKLKLPFTMFAGGPLGDGRQWVPWIHLDDEVRAIQYLAENPAADGPFNLSAPNPVRNKELANAIGDTMGRPAFVPAPGFAIKTALGDMAVMVLEGQKAVPQKLLAMGFDFKYPTIEAALADLVGKEQASAPVPA